MATLVVLQHSQKCSCWCYLHRDSSNKEDDWISSLFLSTDGPLMFSPASMSSKTRLPHVRVRRHQRLPAGRSLWREDQRLPSRSHSFPPPAAAQHVTSTVSNFSKQSSICSSVSPDEWGEGELLNSFSDKEEQDVFFFSKHDSTAFLISWKQTLLMFQKQIFDWGKSFITKEKRNRI